ncbi:hypothetical protein DSO57_1002102 [Entomophthora muscae]|uniref:Uncharacterized protein n=1 Tax=Entomophthora muscae TaxID=34485 RepID=A0ACC2TVT1_9FUNG|nr:hypothetical protein DSO57_1002102 [Entomophthora muscae]
MKLQALFTLLAAAKVGAHVTANPNSAIEGTYFVTVFRIPHGCGNSSTTKVIINYDEELVKDGIAFTPQNVAGWKAASLQSSGAPADSSLNSEHGSGATSSGVAYTDGELPHDMYSDFGLSLKMPMLSGFNPSRNGTLYFAVLQQCKNGEWQNWTSPDSKSFPPPQIKILASNSTKSGSSGAQTHFPAFSLVLAAFAFVSYY